MQNLDLPPPPEDALAHSRRVQSMVLERIDTGGGFLGFADYMSAVLYEPGLGYYSAGAHKFGAGGDFVTAPELGPLFARSVARTVSAALAELRSGVVLELGGGSGRLAADLLTALRQSPPHRYLILEVSGELRERQRRTIETRCPAELHRVTWLDRLPDAPMDGVVIANEVLDALPVERFTILAGRPMQLGVSRTGSALGWTKRTAGAELAAALKVIEADIGFELPDGYASEVCLLQPAWIASIAAALGRGLMLFVDYGTSRRDYYRADRTGGTLACHYRHRMHADPFFLPGLQDITAWVDFTTAARAGIASGLELDTYCTQAHFLLASGVLDELAAAGETDALGAAREARELLLPGSMGEHFKLLAFSRNYRHPLLLGLRDLRDRL